MNLFTLISLLVIWIQTAIAATSSPQALFSIGIDDVPLEVLQSGVLDNTAIFGYAFETGIDSLAIPWNSLTHLILAFLRVDVSGNATVSSSSIQGVIDTAHKNNVKVLASVGGSGDGSTNMASALSTNATQANLAASLTKIISEYDLDGVDYDFEFPDNTQQVNSLYAGLLAMRSALNSKFGKGNKTLTMTLYSTNGRFGPNVPQVNAKPFSDLVDYGLLMSYDYFGSFSSISAPNAPFYDVPGYPGLSFTSSISAWLSAGWAPEKLVAGLPYYGRTAIVQTNSTSTSQFMPNSGAAPPGGPVSKISGAWTWVDLRDPSDGALSAPSQAQTGWSRNWDNTTMTPWLLHDVSSTYIGYDDTASLTIKANHIIASGLAGAMVWMVPYDYQDELAAVMQSYTESCSRISKEAIQSLAESSDSSVDEESGDGINGHGSMDGSSQDYDSAIEQGIDGRSSAAAVYNGQLALSWLSTLVAMACLLISHL
ncbi:hypothetical protein GGI25_002989 [Coemansia spiralis]|uniref:GH18 domain-containing protein n=2 Tax=Coemansia TaxID=4863 RepID=A0A9W8G2X6_9FUNG|nr:glycosyl hydrolases family 18-domain-containing protein [Coemansia spiralis]KAJ1993088.1 hypothetical protein EDC05_002346 [Coemansia umbellata]KAJ2623795.1 hypothetical protein GGI26_002033 [Coemansia sp. RSA 1358]KAJ2677744.1 hypothetical protein GGI25_002989 [Coemansia spiralis]